MRNYELTTIFHPDLEMNLDPALSKVKQTLESNKAKITEEEADGKRRLAYEIDGQQFGIYHYFEMELPTEAPDKISSIFNIADEILRYMLVKTDERKIKLATRRAERTAKTGNTEDENNNLNSEREV